MNTNMPMDQFAANVRAEFKMLSQRCHGALDDILLKQDRIHEELDKNNTDYVKLSGIAFSFASDHETGVPMVRATASFRVVISTRHHK